ncbi:hypothetical protein ACFSTI_15560 [Rhizorhabdus histidinilytica]
MIPAALARNLALPVIAAPMLLVSGPELVIACCRAGVIGSFPAPTPARPRRWRPGSIRSARRWPTARRRPSRSTSSSARPGASGWPPSWRWPNGIAFR